MTTGLIKSVRTLVLAVGLTAAAIASASAESKFEQAKLEAFVTAAVAVEQLVRQWTPRIQKAESPEKADQLRRQAGTELLAAVESTPGITVDEYRQIGEAAQNDPQLAAQIRKIYTDRTN